MTNARSLLCLLLAFAPLSLLADTTGKQVVEKSFVAQGHISMRLEAGDYKIQPAATQVIRVTWDSDSFEGRDQVRATVEVDGNSAKVRVQNTPHNNFHAVIEVPSRSDLFIRLTAGDMTVGDISGNKDIEANAGDLTIEVADPNEYRKVDAASWAGDLNASAFQVSKGGLFRSFTWHGPGNYTLHAHLLAGDLTLRRALRKSSSMF